MSDTNDSNELEVYTTRRRFTQVAGMAAVPLNHGGDASLLDKLLGRDKDHAGVGEDIVIQHNGEEVRRDPKALNFEGASIKEVTEVNDYDGVVRITLEGGSGLWTENQDGSVSPTTQDGSVGVESIGGVHIYASGYGSDDAAIQAALNEHGTAPAVVHVDVSTTVGANLPLEVPSNTEVVIEGDLTKEADNANNVFQNTNHEDDATDDQNLVFRFDGGSIDGNKANQSAGTTPSSGSHASGFYQNAISILGAHDVRVHDPRLSDDQHHGVNFAAVTDGKVTGGVVKRPYYAGVHFHWRESDNTRNENVRAENVTVRGGGSSGKSGGIYLSGFTTGKITDCTIESRGNKGIIVYNGDGALKSTDATVRGNTVVDVMGTAVTDTQAKQERNAGILVWTTDAVTGDGLYGVTVEDNDVRFPNNGTNENQRGVSVQASASNPILDLSIRDNVLAPTNIGVSVYNRSSTIEGSITGNKVDGSTQVSTAAYGILAYGMTNSVIEDNDVRESQKAGIGALNGRNGTTQTNVDIESNTCLDNGRTGNAPYGVYFIEGQDCSVTDNRCGNDATTNQTYGVEIGTNASATLVVLNDLRNNSTGGLNNGGTGTITDPVGGGTTEDYNVT